MTITTTKYWYYHDYYNIQLLKKIIYGSEYFYHSIYFVLDTNFSVFKGEINYSIEEEIMSRESMPFYELAKSNPILAI